MTIEIHRPEVEALLIERMKAGAFESMEEVIMQALESAPPPEPKSAAGGRRQTIASFIVESMKDVPPAVMATMPMDGASEHDHYIYGWPKREA